MEVPLPNFSARRQRLFFFLLLLFMAVGFVWGYWLGRDEGYIQGRRDTLKELEQKLYERPSPAPPPI